MPYSDSLATPLLEAIPWGTRTDTWWFVKRDGRLVPGHPGGSIVLMKEVRLMRWIGALLTALHLSAFIDAVDIYFADKRGGYSRFVPDGPGPRRYP